MSLILNNASNRNIHYAWIQSGTTVTMTLTRTEGAFFPLHSHYNLVSQIVVYCCSGGWNNSREKVDRIGHRASISSLQKFCDEMVARLPVESFFSLRAGWVWDATVHCHGATCFSGSFSCQLYIDILQGRLHKDILTFLRWEVALLWMMSAY